MAYELNTILKKAIDNCLLSTHTLTIGRVEKVNSKTIDVKPVINYAIRGADVEIPTLPDVPIVYMQGGDSYDLHPVSVGDYCLLLVVERSFDQWWSGKDNVTPVENRHHDLSDCVAIVGLRPLGLGREIPQKIKRVGDSEVTGNYEQVGDYTQDGNFELVGDYKQQGNLDIVGEYKQQGNFELIGNYKQQGNLDIVGDLSLTGNLIVTGNVTINGAIQGNLSIAGNVSCGGSFSASAGTIGGVNIATHVHGGVMTGSGVTGGPL
jgi:cytoskeletal protein CcmA (bactofilin family)